MSKKKLRVGIIGTGFGYMHLLGFRGCENVEVVAACQRTPGKAAEFAQKHNIQHAFEDYRPLIEHPDVDVVSIAAPPYVHKEMTFAALEAGKPVLCEKPFAMTAQEGYEMYSKAQSSGLTHATAFNWRYMPGVSYLKELVDSGFPGKVYHASVTWFHGRLGDPNIPLLWRHQKELAGVGVLGDIGPHMIDMTRWTLGDFQSVTAQTATVMSDRQDADSEKTVAPDADDVAMFVSTMTSGATVTIQLSRVAYMSDYQRIELYGSDGTLVYDSDSKAGTWITGRVRGAKRGEKALTEMPIPERFNAGLDTTDLGNSVGNFLFAKLARRFVEGIRTGQSVDPGFLEGVRSQEVIDAVVLSAAEGRRVDNVAQL